MTSLSDSQMRALTRSLRTKADKIRALGRAGMEAGEIRRFLGIRYQHAYNVLKRSGIPVSRRAAYHSDSADAAGEGRTVMDESGRIEIPDSIRRSWNVSAGDELLLRLEDDGLHVFTRDAGLRHARDIMRRYTTPGTSMADELIAERRRDAETDDG